MNVIIEMSPDRDIHIGVKADDKFYIERDISGRCGNDTESTPYITIEDLYTFLKDRDRIILDKAIGLKNEKVLELARENSTLNGQITKMKDELDVLKKDKESLKQAILILEDESTIADTSLTG